MITDGLNDLGLYLFLLISQCSWDDMPHVHKSLRKIHVHSSSQTN